MKRRPFLKTLAAGGAAVSAAPAITGCSTGNGQPVYSEKFKTVPEFDRTLLIADENEFISLKYYSDASAEIIDKKNNQEWKMIPVALQEEGEIDEGAVWLRTERSFCEQYPGYFHGEMQGNRIRFTLYGYLRKFVGQFSCRITLNGSWIDFELSEVDDSIPSLVFPTPIISESLVLPFGVGRWIREPLESRYFWPFFSRMNMRWFGGLKGQNGWMGVFRDGLADGGLMAAQMLASPGWWKSLGTWDNPRSVHYTFTSDGYVGQAKKFREYAIQEGLHVPLESKIEKQPALRNLAGGRSLSFWMSRPPRDEMFYHNRWEPVADDIEKFRDKVHARITYKQAGKIIQQAARLGMKNGIAVYRGWIRDGYDGSHPDIWPPTGALGTLDELKESMDQPDHIISALHDNYQDIYEKVPSFPKGVIRGKDGKMMRGGYWAGGQAYILNSKAGLEYARRNWENLKTLGTQAIYPDTVTAVQTYQTFEEGNRLTRTQDIEYKIELLKFFGEQGLLVGSEEGADFGVPWCGWNESRHKRVQGESIPLWSLIFHDAIFMTRYAGNHLAPIGNGSSAPKYLEDMLWGYHLNYDFRSGDGMDWYEEDFQSTRMADEWHAKIGTAEMVDHQFLTDDMTVEQTFFSTGHSIIVNFGQDARVIDGQTIGGHSFKIV